MYIKYDYAHQLHIEMTKPPGGCRLRASQCQRCHGGGCTASPAGDQLGDGGIWVPLFAGYNLFPMGY